MNVLFDWFGNPIDQATWGKLFMDERHLGEDTVGGYRISTVWMGIDQGFGLTERPLIFETMIFAEYAPSSEERTYRWATESEARVGHAEICAKLTAIEAARERAAMEAPNTGPPTEAPTEGPS